MEPMDIFCLSTVILAGLLYGIIGVVTKKTGWRHRKYEGEAAVAAGWQIIIIFGFFAIVFLCGLLNRE
ncbi:MAG: hypothetical protein JW730_08725 [Anaerolineales bacterium]|nr:hypothetical protein [Anaerolineales bacterium]